MEVSVRAEDWNKVAADLRKFEPALLKTLRKRLRDASQRAVDAVRDKLDESSPDGGPDRGRNRAALAAGTRAAVSFAKRGGSVKVTTTAAKLPDQHKAILAAYNMRRWRHPVFGTGTWEDQSGLPYFYGPVMGAGVRVMREGIQAAIDDAVRAMGAR